MRTMDKWMIPNVTGHHQSPVELCIFVLFFMLLMLSLYSSHSLKIIISVTSHTSFLANWNICNMYLQYDIHIVHVYIVRFTILQVLWSKKDSPRHFTYHEYLSFLVWSIANNAVIFSANLKSETHNALEID